MTQNNTYRDYFKHQAVNHPDLLHADGTKEVFRVIAIDEAMGDFRGNVAEKDYVMRLIDYTYSVSDTGVHEVQKQFTGGFIIAKYYGKRKDGEPNRFEAMQASEKVMDDIIEKMIHDSRNGHPLFYYSLNSRQSINVQLIELTIQSYIGWLCTFQFSNYFRDCTTHADAPAWVDGGTTPFEL